MIKNKKIIRIVIQVLLVLSILGIVMPMIIAGGYTYPCEDDFSYESAARTFGDKHGSLLGALIAAYGYYISWQGTYVPNFLLFFVRAYDRWDLTGIHIVIVTVILLFVFSMFLLMKTLIKNKNSNGMLFLLLIAYVIAFNSSMPGNELEFFYWYTGCLTYALEFAFAMVTLALALQLKDTKRKRKIHILLLLSSVTGLIASGGTLEVTSFNCSWLLLALVLNYKEFLKRKVIAVPFLVSFLGALLNACAIGNFIRSNSTMGIQYGIGDALKDTFICWKKSVEYYV